MEPSIGRIVHYTTAGQATVLPAIITHVNEGAEETQLVSLTIFGRGGTFMRNDVPRSDDSSEGHWNWPPRV